MSGYDSAVRSGHGLSGVRIIWPRVCVLCGNGVWGVVFSDRGEVCLACDHDIHVAKDAANLAARSDGTEAL